MDIVAILGSELNIRTEQVEAVIRLIDEGNTIPFIARYRKEAHGGLNDEQLRTLDERLKYLRGLEERKNQVQKAIEDQGKWNADLAAKLAGAQTLVAVEDIYRPYKQKRRTKATIAKERGLEGLAASILLSQKNQKADLTALAAPFVNPDKEVPDVETAIAGAGDIIAEQISDEADYRTYIRKITLAEGKLISEAKDDTAESVYEMYYHFEEPAARLAGHRVMAVNRGEKEKFLTVKLEAPVEKILRYLEKKVLVGEHPTITPMLKAVIADSYTRLIAPAIEREIRNELTEKAEEGAINVFGKNLTQLLMQPPIAGQVVLGWDPGIRTGCKLAVVDETGKVLDTAVVYGTLGGDKKIAETKQMMKRLITKYHVTLISCGNGTASRESEKIISDFIHETGLKVAYVITNEAGASVYSASKLATEEFPDFDVTQRSAVSIARRVQDPLAELVKIEPKAIGVGQYQHDVNQKKLEETLTAVVEDCVNHVGVDLNTASASLLEYISGVSKTIAKNIVTYREQNGQFTDRKQLLKVEKLGPKAFEQCAGFMRIRDGKNPLDATAVHPESYEAAGKLIRLAGLDPEMIRRGVPGLGKKLGDRRKLAADLGIGELTLADMIAELEKPGRDPREEMPKPILRTDVLAMEDLKPGMILKGTVRNVIDFGAFVDIGVHQDGLVHISQICDRYIKHPLEALSVGDIVDVKVMSVDLKKKRIQLTMKLNETAK